MSTTMIEFDDVRKRYGHVHALGGVSFTIPAGRCFGYIGPNGAGKTTSLKILVGLLRDFQGEARIAGRGVRGGASFKDIGYLPQDTGFQPWRTVYHALYTLGRLSGIAKRDLPGRIDSVLEKTDLAESRNRRVAHLSGGMRQRLLFAQAVLHDPAVLVLDEPFNGLDPESRYRMKNLILDYKHSGHTIVFSSHILSDVEDLADIIGILHKGRLAKIGSPKALRDEFLLADSLLVELCRAYPEFSELKSLPSVELVVRVGRGRGESEADISTDITGGSGTAGGTAREDHSSPRYRIVLKPAQDIESALREILAAIAERGIAVSSFGLEQPSLEDVYLHFTTAAGAEGTTDAAGTVGSAGAAGGERSAAGAGGAK